MKVSTPAPQKKAFFPLLLLVTVLFLAALGFLFLRKNFSPTPGPAVPESSAVSDSLVTINGYSSADTLVAAGYGCVVFEKGVLLTGTEIIREFPARLELITPTGIILDIDGIFGGSREQGFLLLSFDPAESPAPLTAAALPREGDSALFMGSSAGRITFLSGGAETDLAFSSEGNPAPGDFLMNANGQLTGIVLSVQEDEYAATSAWDIAATYEQNKHTTNSLRSFYRTLPGFDPASDDLETILDDIAGR